MQHKSNIFISIAAMLIAVIAIFFSISSFSMDNDTDISDVRAEIANVEESLESQMEETEQQLRAEMRISEARIRLLLIQEALEQEGSYAQAAAEIASLRETIREDYGDFSDIPAPNRETLQELITLHNSLLGLEEQLREGSVQSLVTLEQILSELDVEGLGPEEECILAGGEWEQFPNTCVDSCQYRRGEVDFCGQALTMGCDCGDGMCWNGVDCVQI